MSHSLFLLNEKKVTNPKSTDDPSIANVKNNSIAQEYKSDIDIITTYKIYIQSIEKVMTLLKDVMHLLDQQKIEEANYNRDIEIKNSIHTKITTIESIINEFTKLFSVIKNSDLENIYNHLFMKFSGNRNSIKAIFYQTGYQIRPKLLKVM